jgi:hypothetical protein
VNGTTGNDAINQNGNTITVNNAAVVNFTAYPTLTLNGNNGDDVLSIRPGSLVGVTTLNVNGNDPTASDVVIVTGGAGVDTLTITPLTADSATVTGLLGPVVNVNTAESLTYNGLGGNDLVTVAAPAASTTTYTPGVTPDAAGLQVNSLIPLALTNLGAGGQSVQLAAGAASTLVYNGTNVNDVFAVTVGTPVTDGRVTLNAQLPVETSGVPTLTLNGLLGDDSFTVTAVAANPLPFTAINLNGGEPSASPARWCSRQERPRRPSPAPA